MVNNPCALRSEHDQPKHVQSMSEKLADVGLTYSITTDLGQRQKSA